MTNNFHSLQTPVNVKNVFSKLIAVNETQPKTESRGEKERAGKKKNNNNNNTVDEANNLIIGYLV